MKTSFLALFAAILFSGCVAVPVATPVYSGPVVVQQPASGYAVPPVYYAPPMYYAPAYYYPPIGIGIGVRIGGSHRHRR